MSAAVLVPRREGDPHRDAVWAWLQTRLEDDGWDIYEGHHDDGLFNRAAAVNRAAAQTDAGVLVVMDADTLVDSHQITAAVAIARDTGTLAFGFHRYCALSEEGTRLVMDGYDGDWEPHILYEFENTASSCLAVRRDLWEKVGGFDERFVGWAFEDCAFSLACQAIGGGMHRVAGAAFHLWHEPAEAAGDVDHPIYVANKLRCEPYIEAGWDDYDAMRQVLIDLGQWHRKM